MSEINENGYLRTTLPEYLAMLENAARDIYGHNINIDPDTPDGQWIGIHAEALSNLDQLIEGVYHQLNPETAQGVALSRLVRLNGLRRQAGSYSVATLTITGTPGVVIPAGSLVRSTLTNDTFTIINDAIIGANGNVNVQSRAEVMGPVAAPANTLTRIVSPMYGWASVTNQHPAIMGSFEETDAQLRLRRFRSTATPGTNTVESIYGNLANLPGVLATRVYENPTTTTDANGIPAHSIEAVVMGGLDPDIAQVIFDRKSAGAPTFGSSSATVKDIRGNNHMIRFSRPVEVPVYMVINLKRNASWPADGQQRIRDAIMRWASQNIGIADNVIVSRVYDPINTVPGHSITSIKVGAAPNPSASADLPIPYNGIARFSPDRIIVIVNAT